jgi:hypothetical protein
VADVFISYKREDRAWAERIDAALRERGWSTWWDTSLVAGEHFNEAIDRELAAARCVVVVWSEGSRKSRWVNAEAVSGFDRDILVACRIDDVGLSYPFSVVQTADIRRGDISAVLDGVHANLSGETPVRVAVRAKAEQEVSPINYGRRLWIGLALLAFASVAGVGLGGAMGGQALQQTPILSAFVFAYILTYPFVAGSGCFLVASSRARR